MDGKAHSLIHPFLLHCIVVISTLKMIIQTPQLSNDIH